MKVLGSFLLTFLGFCFVIAAVVSLSTVISYIASVNVNQSFNLGAEIVEMSVSEQNLLTFLYAGELAVGTLLIKLGQKLW